MPRNLVIALAAVGIATVGGGAAAAARPASHMMDVVLPDGSSAHIQYYGDVAPKVTVSRGQVAPSSMGWAPMAMPNFSRIDRMMAQMERQRANILRQVQQMPRHGIGPGPAATIASYGNLPAGTRSVSVVSVNNGAGTCTRTTEVTSQGARKRPKVVTNVSGTCNAEASQAKPSAVTAPDPRRPMDHT